MNAKTREETVMVEGVRHDGSVKSVDESWLSLIVASVITYEDQYCAKQLGLYVIEVANLQIKRVLCYIWGLMMEWYNKMISRFKLSQFLLLSPAVRCSIHHTVHTQLNKRKKWSVADLRSCNRRTLQSAALSLWCQYSCTDLNQRMPSLTGHYLLPI